MEPSSPRCQPLEFDRSIFMKSSKFSVGCYAEALEQLGRQFISDETLTELLGEVNGLTDAHAFYVLRWSLKRRLPASAQIAIERLSTMLAWGMQLALCHELRAARIVTRHQLDLMRDITPIVPLVEWDFFLHDLESNLLDAT